MKAILQISVVLSWFNLVVSGFLVLSSLLLSAMAADTLSLLTLVMLIGAILLHSYAALQLRKSILNPQIPLGRQTPVGIRFIGFVSLFCGLMIIGNAAYMIQHGKELVQQVKLPVQSPNLDVSKILRGSAIFTLIFGLSVALNTIINFRLLRWYLLPSNQDNAGT